MHELSLFTGIGGGLLGSLLLGWRTVCGVEKNPYCREVLLRRQSDGVFPMFPIWDDVRTFDGRPWRGRVDIVTAGFPCQPFSVAGKRRAENDDRNMWPDTIRIIREVRPRFAFLENVPGLLATDYFGRILGDLAESGFDAEWEIVSAAEVGAPHLRKRLWIFVSDANGSRRRISEISRTQFKGEANFNDDGEKEFVADSQGERRFEGGQVINSQRLSPYRSRKEYIAGKSECVRSFWAVEPDIRRVADGVPFRVDRLRALGNGQVPGVVRKAWGNLI